MQKQIWINSAYGFVTLFMLLNCVLSTISGTCTQGADDETMGGLIVATPLFIVAYFMLVFVKDWRPPAFLLALQAIPIIYVMYWYGGLFWTVNMQGKNSCSWKMGDEYDYETAELDYYVAPYAFLSIGIFLCLTIRKFYRTHSFQTQ